MMEVQWHQLHMFYLNKWMSLLCRPLGGGWNFNYDLLVQGCPPIDNMDKDFSFLKWNAQNAQKVLSILWMGWSFCGLFKHTSLVSLDY